MTDFLGVRDLLIDGEIAVRLNERDEAARSLEKASVLDDPLASGEPEWCNIPADFSYRRGHAGHAARWKSNVKSPPSREPG